MDTPEGGIIPQEKNSVKKKKKPKYALSPNAFSKALTASEWIKYNNAITSGFDAGLRINDHAMLVEGENSPFQYKLVIYDNSFEENPVTAVYGMAEIDYNEKTAHEIAELICELEDKKYDNIRVRSKIFSTMSNNVGCVLRRYNARSGRFDKYGREISESRRAIQTESSRGAVYRGNKKSEVKNSVKKREKPKYALSPNAFSKALTASEWIKYNNAMTSGFDAGLRINDHAMLVEGENSPFQYKLVIYDNSFEETPVTAVYGMAEIDYTEEDVHAIAKFVVDLEDKKYDRKVRKAILRTYFENLGCVLWRYSITGNSKGKYGREVQKGRRNIQSESSRGAVYRGNKKTEVKNSLKDEVNIYDDIYYPKNLRERSAFNRSIANKTSDMQDGEIRKLVIYTENNVYFVTAYGYMSGDIEEVLEIKATSEEIKQRVDEFYEQNSGNRRNAVDEIRVFEDGKGYGSWDFDGIGDEGKYAETVPSNSGSSFVDGVGRFRRNIKDNGSQREKAEVNRGNGKAKGPKLSIKDSDTVAYSDIVNLNSNRSILSNALESTGQNDVERKYIREYKANIENLDSQEKRLKEINAGIRTISFSKGKRDKKKLAELHEEKRKTENRINIYDKKLLRLESTKPISDLLEREKKRVKKQIPIGICLFQLNPLL